MEYYGNGGFIFAWDLGVIFFVRTQFGIDRFLEEKFFKISILKVL